MFRGLIHFHSSYSYDSTLSIIDICKFARENDLNFLILTDHEKIAGSIELKNYCSKNELEIEVIEAAEYKTDYGDVIAVGIKSEICCTNFYEFVRQVRKQDGLILFPHPYVGHKNVEEIAKFADLIETFNSRVSDSLNEKAAALSAKFNKPSYCSSDAHTFYSLKNSIIEFDKCGTIIESLQRSNIRQITRFKTFEIEVIYSQLVKSIKKRDFKLLAAQIKKVFILVLKFKLFKRA